MASFYNAQHSLFLSLFQVDSTSPNYLWAVKFLFGLVDGFNRFIAAGCIWLVWAMAIPRSSRLSIILYYNAIITLLVITKGL